MAGFSATYTRGYQVAGQSFGTNSSIVSALQTGWSEALATAKTGALTTRTSATAGTLTMDAGHGITTGARLDIYWDGGSCYGATVGTVSTNSVPFTLAQGDSLPVATTAITAQVPTTAAVVVTGNNVVAYGVSFSNGGTVVFAASDNSTIAAVRPTGTNASNVYTNTDGGSNPLSGGSVAKVFLSQGSSTLAATAMGVVQFN